MNISKRINTSKGHLAVIGVAMIFAAVFLTADVASAQPAADLDLTFGGAEDDFAHAVVETIGGGYVIAGETQSFGAGGRDFWLIKIDAFGNQLWTRTFGGPADDVAYAVAQTSDGGLVVAGSSAQDPGSKTDFLLIKTDSLGIQQWSQRYANLGLPGILDSESDDIAYAVRQTDDGGYIIAGSTDGQNGQDAWLVKTDADGVLDWAKEFGASGSETAFSVQQTGDGGYVVAGSTDSVDLASNGGSDFWLLKTDSLGAESWTNTLGGEFNDEARSVVQTADGGFALAGITWSSGAGFSDFWLVKTDPTGEEEWNQTYGGVSRDAAYGLQQTQDGGYVLGGWSESFLGGDHFWVVKTDAAGTLEWDKTYGESSGARAIQQTVDGGYVIAGWTGPLEGMRDIRMVKTLPDGAGTAPVEGSVVVLENQGSTPITSAAVAFDTSAGDSPYLFAYQGRFLSQSNPLPINAVACTAPIPGLVNGSHLALDQFEANGVLFIDRVTTGLSALEIQIDTTLIPFDLAFQNPTGDRINGRYFIVSESLCADETPVGEPSAATGLTVTAPDAGSGTLFLDWNDNPEANIAGYNVYLSLAKTGPYGLVATSLAESQYIDSGLTDGTEYHYVVSAVNIDGTESAKSTVTSSIPADLTPSDAPMGLRVTAVDRGIGTVELDWEDNPESDLAGYNVYRRLGNVDSFSQIASGVLTSSYIDREVPDDVGFLYVVSAIDIDGNESARSNFAPLPMDFFGTVLGFRSSAFDERVLVLRTNQGRAEVVVTRETEVRVPQVENAAIADLSNGDLVAVTLKRQNGRLAADKIRLVPSKTQNRHVPGTVISFSDAQITIQPPGNGKAPIAFTLSGALVIKFHRGITQIEEGAFVVVGAVRDPGTGQLSPMAVEIDVTKAKKANQGQSGRARAKAKPNKSAKLRGVFQGVNPDNGNLILAGVEISLNADTEIQAGMVAGDAVEIEAEVLPDGSLLALKVEREDSGDEEVSEMTRLDGVFEGIDQVTGRWIISGTLVRISGRTDTDGRPRLGQRVRVKALLQDDGSLLAREIENEMGRGRPSDQDNETVLEGIFQGRDSEGNWIISGRKVAVDTLTELEGSPSVGRRVAVKAIKDSAGRLLALRIKDESDDKRETKREAKIKGVVDLVLIDGGLVVDGIRVAVSALTELAINVKAGDRVEIKALLQDNGVYLARQVEADLDEDGEESEENANPVDIEGVIEKVNPDGSLVVNGIQIATSALSDVRGDLKTGAAVRVRGLLGKDGVVLARSLRSQGRNATKSATEAKLEGRVERVNRNDDGSIRSVVVNGVTVTVDALTETDPDLVMGSSVEVKGILNNGRFLAGKLDQKQRVRGETDDGELEIKGVIEEVKRNVEGRVLAVVINGVEFGVAPLAQLRGRLEVGEEVELKGRVKDGALVAEKVESRESNPKKGRTTKFDIEGIVESVIKDAEGKLVGLVVAGEKITVESLSRARGEVSEGDTVRIDGLNRNGVLLAVVIVPVTNQDRAASNRKNEEARSKGARESLPEAAKQARERARLQAAEAREEAKAAREKSRDRGNGGGKSDDDNDAGSSNGSSDEAEDNNSDSGSG